MDLIKATSKSFPVALVGKHWATPRMPRRWPSLHQNSYCVRLPTFVVKVPVKNKATVMAYSASRIGKTARMTFQCHSAGTTFKKASGPLSDTLSSLRFGSCPAVSPRSRFYAVPGSRAGHPFSSLVCVGHLCGCNV